LGSVKSVNKIYVIVRAYSSDDGWRLFRFSRSRLGLEEYTQDEAVTVVLRAGAKQPALERGTQLHLEELDGLLKQLEEIDQKES